MLRGMHTIRFGICPPFGRTRIGADIMSDDIISCFIPIVYPHPGLPQYMSFGRYCSLACLPLPLAILNGHMKKQLTFFVLDSTTITGFMFIFIIEKGRQNS